MALFKKRVVEPADDETNATLVMPGVADIIEVREESWAEIITGWARSLLGFLLLAAVLLALLYTVLVSTVLFFTQVGDRQVLVARNTYVAGIATKGTEVYASTKANNDTFIGRLQTGFLGAPNPSIYKILSGPYDTVRYDGTKVFVNDKQVGMLNKPSTAQTVVLSKQYLVECMSGACASSKTNIGIISTVDVYGQIKRG